MNRYRAIAASLLAPLAFVVLPVALGVYELYADSVLLLDGSVDDAGQRGAGIFLLIVFPVLYAVVSVYFAGAAHVLSRLNRLSLKGFLFLSVVASFLFSLLLAVLPVMGPGFLVRVLIFGAVGLFVSICACLGTLLWWYVAFGTQHVAPPDAANSAARVS